MWASTPEVHSSPWLHSVVKTWAETSEISETIQGCAPPYWFCCFFICPCVVKPWNSWYYISISEVSSRIQMYISNITSFFELHDPQSSADAFSVFGNVGISTKKDPVALMWLRWILFHAFKLHARHSELSIDALNVMLFFFFYNLIWLHLWQIEVIGH